MLFVGNVEIQYLMKGSVIFRFPKREQFEMTLFAKSAFRNPDYRYEQASLRGTVPPFATNFISLMTPFLHILASYTAVPPLNSTMHRIFNIISLTDHYKDGFQLIYKMKVGSIGIVHVAITTSDTPGTRNPEANVLVSVDSNFDADKIDRVYVDRENFMNLNTDTSQYLAYRKAGNNRGITVLPFKRTFVPFDASSEAQLQITISGTGLYNEACLMEKQSLWNSEDVYELVLTTGSYCIVEFGPRRGDVQLYCFDRSVLVKGNHWDNTG